MTEFADLQCALNGGLLYIQPAAPANPPKNSVWIDTATPSIQSWDGTNWVPVNAGGGGGVVGRFLPLAGGTMDQPAVVQFDVPPGAPPATPVVRLSGGDAAKSALDEWTISGGVVGAGVLPVSYTVSGVNTDTVNLAFTGGPTNRQRTFTPMMTLSAGAVAAMTPVIIPSGTALAGILPLIAAEFDKSADISATVAGNGISIVNTAGNTITELKLL